MDNYRHIKIHNIYKYAGIRSTSTDEEITEAFRIWAPLSADFLHIIRKGLESYEVVLDLASYPDNALPIYELVIPPNL